MTKPLFEISVIIENMNVEPSPIYEVASIVPFNYSAIFLQILKPSP